MYRLPTLFLLSVIVLVETASARPPSGFGRPAKDTSSDSETNWYLGERDAVVKQTSRNEILTRGRQKAARQQVDAAHKRWLGPGLSQRPGTFGQRSKRAFDEPAPAGVSAVPGKRGMRLECPVDGVEAGWARFPGWELEWDDVSRLFWYCVEGWVRVGMAGRLDWEVRGDGRRRVQGRTI